MTVRRMAVAVAAATMLSLAGGRAMASTPAPTTTSGAYWGCVGVNAVDLGLCVKDPIPHPLPVPQTPAP